jgi:hypothetical protein
MTSIKIKRVYDPFHQDNPAYISPGLADGEASTDMQMNRHPALSFYSKPATYPDKKSA